MFITSILYLPYCFTVPTRLTIMAEGGKKPASYRWESLKSMPTKRVFATAVEVDNNIYVVGGCDQKGTPLNSFEVYYTEKREWKKLKPLPTKRASVAAVAVGKKIVVIGGVSESQTPMDAVEMYDIETKQWTQMESMKDGLLGVSAVVKGRCALYYNVFEF